MAKVIVYSRRGRRAGIVDRDKSYRPEYWRKTSIIWPNRIHLEPGEGEDELYAILDDPIEFYERLEILLGLRSRRKKTCKGMWIPPAETLYVKENHRKAAQRASKEEFGIVHSKSELRPLQEVGELRVTVARTREFTDNQIQRHYTFFCDLTPEELRRLKLGRNEVDEVGYYSWNDLGKPPLVMPWANGDMSRIGEAIRNYHQSLREGSNLDYIALNGLSREGDLGSERRSA